MKGIQFLVDEHGEKTAVLIDLTKNRSLWEDFYDRSVVEQRRGEPRESLDAVRRRLIRAGKLRADG